MHSVVRIMLAIDVAFCKAERVTLAGSTTPSLYILPNIFFAALYPISNFCSCTFQITTGPLIPAFSAILFKGARIAREIIIAPINSSSFKLVFDHVTKFSDK